MTLKITLPGPERPLDTSNDSRALGIQLVRIPLVALLLTVLQPTTPMIFQHAMLAAEMALAKPAVADDPLRRVLAIFEVAFYFLGWHAAADG